MLCIGLFIQNGRILHYDYPSWVILHIMAHGFIELHNPLHYDKAVIHETSTSISLVMLNLLTVWIIANCGKFLKEWEYQTTLPISWETCMWIKTQQLESDMEQLTGSKLGKVYYKTVYCHPA